MKFRLTYFLALTFIICFLYAAVIDAQVVIIANKNLPVKSIDNNSLVNLYILQSNELSGQKVKLFYSNTENEAVTKLLQIIGKSGSELKKIWLKAKLTGNGNPPENAFSDEDMIQKVASTPNSIGFVSLKSANASVKILLKLD
jgi:ABC-type phosphate transport system substrate-binding protein